MTDPSQPQLIESDDAGGGFHYVCHVSVELRVDGIEQSPKDQADGSAQHTGDGDHDQQSGYRVGGLPAERYAYDAGDDCE
jgi:hypothetical protein